jgi:uncharacterized iron-regulated membrane protein
MASRVVPEEPASPPEAAAARRPAVKPKRRPLLNNKLLFAIHGWLGLSLGLPLFIICLSGSFAVVSHEIDWLLTPAMRAPAHDGPVNWDAVAEQVRREYPEAPLTFLWAPEGPGFAAEAWLRTPEGNRRVFADPATGEVLGTTGWFNTQRFFRDFHRRFFWYSVWGIWLVSSFAVILFATAFAGLLFYKRWWAKLFTLRVHRGGRMFFSDLHRMTGVWTLLFALLISLTGLWYLVEKPLLRSMPDLLPKLPRLTGERLAELGPVAAPLSIGEYARIARETHPGLQIKVIWLPTKPGAPVQIQGQGAAWLIRDRANKVLLDPYSGEVLYHQRAQELGPLARWVDTADPLHFGNFGGLATKLVWFGFGLLLSLLMPTGVYLWTKRAEQAAAGAAKRMRGQSDADIAREVRRATRRRTGLGLAITSAILLLAATTTYHALADQLPGPVISEAQSSSQTLGPWTVRLFREFNGADDERATFGARFDDREGVANFRRVRLAFSEAPPGEDEGTVLKARFDLREREARLRLPAAPTGRERLWLAVEDWNGERHVADFDPRALDAANARPAGLAPLTAWRSLGGPRVILFYSAFLAVLIAAAIFWYRAVWFRRVISW